MKVGQASGFQIAFLMYAVMLLAVPLSSLAVRWTSLEGAAKTAIDKGAHFALACLVIAAFPALRRTVLQAMSRPIPGEMRSEVAAVAILKIVLGLGSIAGLALWFWLTDGPARVDRMTVNVEREWANAFSADGLVRLALAATIGPIVEEIVFRGLMYPAFERQWGWVGAMVMTSVLFGLYHPHFWHAFAASVLLVCLMRRTGSLRAPIVVHMFYNLMLWWPLLGQYVFPHGAVLSELATWRFHGACLAVTAMALPTYVWMSRDRRAKAPAAHRESNGPLPQ